MRHETKQKLQIRERRIFSEDIKKKSVNDLTSKRTTIKALMNEHQISHQTVYQWLYKYSPYHEQKCTLVVQMKSEETKNSELQKRVADLERIVGQKQLEIDFLNKLFEIGSSELGFDLKKNFKHSTIEWYRWHRRSVKMNDVFALCGISRQAHFQALQRHLWEQEKAELYVRSMELVREIHPGMGLRTMYDMLQPEGIGRDAFVALGLEEGFRLKTVEKQTRTTYSVKSNRYGNLLGGVEFNGINQLWSSDITYLYCLNQFFYIVMIMDIYSRRIVGYHLADNMRAENNLLALKMALKLRAIANYHQGLIHHSDKGTQYASDAYTEELGNYEIRISMCREVYENTHIERLNDTIKNQYLNRREINNRKQLQNKLDETIKTYNETRPHQSLHKMSPVQYENYILSIPVEKRNKMKIYTIKLNTDAAITKQLNLFDKEIKY